MKSCSSPQSTLFFQDLSILILHPFQSLYSRWRTKVISGLLLAVVTSATGSNSDQSNGVSDFVWVKDSWFYSPTWRFLKTDDSGWIFPVELQQWFYPLANGDGKWAWSASGSWLWVGDKLFPWGYDPLTSRYIYMGSDSTIEPLDDEDLLLITDADDFISPKTLPAVFSLSLSRDGISFPHTTIRYEVTWDGYEPALAGEVISKLQPVEIVVPTGRSGILTAHAAVNGEFDADGGPSTVIAVSPLEIQPGQTLPPDFSTFWTNNVARQAGILMLPQLRNVGDMPSGTVVSTVRINALGGQNCVGYFGKPASAPAGSLPAVLRIDTGGVHDQGSSFASKAGVWGALVFDMSLHGMDLGKPDTYYIDLADGILNGYLVKNETSRQNSYWMGVLMRVARALQFLETQVEWDGKTLIVAGCKEGGALAIAASAFSGKVSHLVAAAPALCDQMGYAAGHSCAYPWSAFGGQPPPYPVMTYDSSLASVWSYYDPVNFASRAFAEANVLIPFQDLVHRPAGMYAMFNELRSSEKIVIPFPTSNADDPELSSELERLVQTILGIDTTPEVAGTPPRIR